MTGKIPSEHQGNSARIFDITSRLPALTPAQENTDPHEGLSENIVQFTQKGAHNILSHHEERESQDLEIVLQSLYLKLDKEIKIFDQSYSRLDTIPNDLSAWENNNNQIFTTISSNNQGIYCETDSIQATTGDNILTEGFFQERYNNTTGKEAIFTIKTSRGIKIKEIPISGIPEIIRMEYIGISQFSIRFIHQEQHQPENIPIIVNMSLYNEKGELQDSLRPTKISEKKIIELCYREAIGTIQRLTHQLNLYR